MRVLFVHHTFPGPFRHLAVQLGVQADTSVVFLSERARRDVRLPGVRRLVVTSTPAVTPEPDPAERELMAAARRGASMANALMSLRQEGFMPDIICASSGGGNSLYLRDVFPRAFYAVYADWFYTKGANHTFFTHGRSRSPADFVPGRIRNLVQLNALMECDMAVTSTHWQKAQYPPQVAQCIHVLHEGVDTDFFSPNPDQPFVVDGCDLAHVRELVTFSGRSADPFRGFPQFARCLPRLLAARPACHVVIMVADKHQGELPDALAAALHSMPADDAARVHFLGFRPYEDYRRLLRASTAHVYLTAPFALSAGLFEAMSCGCMVVGSDTEPVREVIQHGRNGFLCDFWDTEALADTLTGLLQRPELMQAVRTAARTTMLEYYSMATLAPQHLHLLLSAHAARHKQD